MNDTTVVGIPWYRRGDWDGLLEMFADADKLHDSYDDWLKDVLEIENHLRQQGYTVKRVPLEAEAFSDWCALRGLALDAEARSEYAAQMVRLEHQSDD